MKQFEREQLIHRLEKEGRFSKEIGIHIEEVTDESARGSITIQEKHLNPMGMVHGGCIYALADTIAGVAATAHGHFVVTVSGSINYLEAAVNTKKITAHAHQLRFGKHLAYYDIEILNDDGILLAKGDFCYYNTGEKITGQK